MTDANIELRLVEGIDLDLCKRFVHTPKDGHCAPDDAEFFIKNYKDNKFIQTFMKDVDVKTTTWAESQPPKIARAFTIDFLKFATDASPMRSARK